MSLACLLRHDFRITGHLNADRFSWTDPRIGEYEACPCGAWRLEYSRENHDAAQEAVAIYRAKNLSTPNLGRRLYNHIR